jgi:hypothetical protein
MEQGSMTRLVSLVRSLSPAAVLALVLGLALTTLEGRQLPMDALKDTGQAIYPAFEGWYQNADGSYSLLMGYYNRNQKQTLEIPIGPNNRIEPGGPDLGQPTYFQLRRGWGVFAIKVPKDFGSEKRYTWTIVANGKTASVPVGLIKDYQIEPFKDAAEGNLPPVLKFSPTGKTFTGPPVETALQLTGTVGQPVTLEVFTTDDLHRRWPRAPRASCSRGTSTAALAPSRSRNSVRRSAPTASRARRRPSLRPASTRCARRPMTTRVKAAEGFSAAGPTPT